MTKRIGHYRALVFLLALALLPLSSCVVGGNRAPDAEIVEPDDGSYFSVGEQIGFRGRGDDPDDDHIDFEWDFGDGFYSTSSEAYHSYDSAGTYTVTFTVEDEFGSRDRDRITVYITEAAALKVINRASLSMYELYVSPSTSDTWGEDHLDSPLRPDESITIINIPEDTYDMKAVSSGGVAYYDFGFGLYEGQTVNRYIYDVGEIEVSNQSSQSIVGVYISPTTSDTWGDNQISSPITPGEILSFVNIDPGMYDIMIVTYDGTEIFSYDTEVSSWGVTSIVVRD